VGERGERKSERDRGEEEKNIMKESSEREEQEREKE